MLSHGVEYGRKWKVFPTLAHTDVKHSNVERLSPERETHVWAIERLSIVHKESLQREAFNVKLRDTWRVSIELHIRVVTELPRRMVASRIPSHGDPCLI